jgi:8-oxo-dGTP pyrophosphatase MutT (NUDIX family)
MKSAKIFLKGFAMNAKNSHCSFCGSAFPSNDSWPRHCHHCGNSSYLNPIPVVVMLLPVGDGLILIRRGIEPARGTLTLPGGYMDTGETWQEAGVRELKEETGISVAADDIILYDVMNGLDDTVIIFGLAKPQPLSVYRPFSSEETVEVVVIREPEELGFPMHTQVVARYFNEMVTMR